MTVDEAKDMLAHFASRAKRTRLAGVHLNGGFAYVSDGRIAFRASVDHEVDNDACQFPFKAIDGFAQRVDNASRWMKMDLEKFTEVEKLFSQAMKASEVEKRREILRRYKHCQCPCCGNDVYWDDDLKEFVELEDLEAGDSHPSDVGFPVRLNLQDGTYLNVAFWYLHLARKAFGTEVLFSREVADKGDVAHLLMKTSDGAVKGVLMPLMVNEWFVPEHIIDTHAHEGGVKEAPADGKAD